MKNCRKRLLRGETCQSISSNINEVIKAVFFFCEKISHAQKAQEAQISQKASKALKGTKTLRQKHKNANKRINDYFPLRCFLRTFFIFARL